MTLLERVKTACRVSSPAYDEEFLGLVEAAMADLGVTNIRSDLFVIGNVDPLIQRAVITYCRLNFGSPDEYDRLKASYDEQKAQLSMSSAYTDWTVSADGQE
jgi:hypothetical protein